MHPWGRPDCRLSPALWGPCSPPPAPQPRGRRRTVHSCAPPLYQITSGNGIPGHTTGTPPIPDHPPAFCPLRSPARSKPANNLKLPSPARPPRVGTGPCPGPLGPLSSRRTTRTPRSHFQPRPSLTLPESESPRLSESPCLSESPGQGRRRCPSRRGPGRRRAGDQAADAPQPLPPSESSSGPRGVRISCVAVTSAGGLGSQPSDGGRILPTAASGSLTVRPREGIRAVPNRRLLLGCMSPVPFQTASRQIRDRSARPEPRPPRRAEVCSGFGALHPSPSRRVRVTMPWW